MGVSRDCSELRRSNLGKLRELGLTYREIGKLYGTSCVQVHYWLNGRHPVRLRAKPGVCEVCGKARVLNYHHWGDPKIGLWLCPECHVAAGVLEKMPAFPEIYFALRESVQSKFTSQGVPYACS